MYFLVSLACRCSLFLSVHSTSTLEIIHEDVNGHMKLRGLVEEVDAGIDFIQNKYVPMVCSDCLKISRPGWHFLTMLAY